MNDEQKDSWFSDIDEIVIEPLKFKAKLAIGENAYASLRLKNTLYKVWDVGGVTGTAAVAAKSTVVASAFFAPTGFLAAIGFGAAAVTPIGWIVTAGVLSGGAWMGITSYIKNLSDGQVTVIPNFINTPLDVLALALFDLIAPLALKIAVIDGEIDPEERKTIGTYFINEWGYDSEFIDRGLTFIETRLSNFSIKSLAETLAEFQKQNPDCNFKSMTKEIIDFLRNVIEADGIIDEREEMALEKVESVFLEASKINISKTTQAGWETVSKATNDVIDKGKNITKRFVSKKDET